jgi:hypothetical protein
MNEYTNVNRRSTLGKDSGLIVCRISKCKHPTQDNFKDSKTAQYHIRELNSEPPNMTKKYTRPGQSVVQ